MVLRHLFDSRLLEAFREQTTAQGTCNEDGIYTLNSTAINDCEPFGQNKIQKKRFRFKRQELNFLKRYVIHDLNLKCMSIDLRVY